MLIPLFLVDFKRFVKSEQFKSGDFIHPTLYFEDEAGITFYKPVGNFIYRTTILKEQVVENGTISPSKEELTVLKNEFNATEIPSPLPRPQVINIGGQIQ